MLESEERAGENQGSIFLYLDKYPEIVLISVFSKTTFFCTLLSCVSQ